MAKLDWNIMPYGGSYQILTEAGSKILKLTDIIYFMWNGRNDLANSEVIADVKLGAGSYYCNPGFFLRGDATMQNVYALFISGAVRRYRVFKELGGSWIMLAEAFGDQGYDLWLKTRFRIDGNVLTVEREIDQQWELMLFTEDLNNPHTEGYAGIGSRSTGGRYSFFDNVEIGERS